MIYTELASGTFAKVADGPCFARRRAHGCCAGRRAGKSGSEEGTRVDQDAGTMASRRSKRSRGNEQVPTCCMGISRLLHEQRETQSEVTHSFS